ncbi:MAG: Asp-tRNA(Asn)/Glu-tRNA(Gln) amidotransferase subunit GatA [Dehalococcoidia bacterium]
MIQPLYEQTAHELSALLARREVSSREITQAFLDRIQAVGDQTGSYLRVTSGRALEQAGAADKRLAAGDDVTPLTGIPIALKDVIITEGIVTTAGSRMLEGFVPPFNATVVKKLEQAGTVMLGKLNMDEFAMGSSTENSAFQVTRNPWDLERVPGGSSGGSAAAVASGEAPLTLGSDTGGSIRQPAALCGIVGIKPTYGRVSRYGLIAFGSSLDQIGPFARDVEDAARLLSTIAGPDPLDATSAPMPVLDLTTALTGDVKGLRIGVPREYFVEGMTDGVRGAVTEAINTLVSLGAEVDWEVSLPSTSAALAVYYIIAPSEASANLARFDGVKYGYAYQDGASMWENMEQTRGRGFGDEVKRRIMIGTYALSAGYYDAYYLKAQKVRTLIRQEFEDAFSRYDVLITPTAPTPAFRIGEKTDDPVQMYLSDVCTLPINIAGIPGVSVPCGFENGLPVGLQILGRAFDEATMLRVAHAYEQATDWHKRRAELTAADPSPGPSPR